MQQTEPTQQRPRRQRKKPIPAQAQPERLTPVYGTAQPGGGPSGQLRALAYARPDHDPYHWLLLLAADRIDVGGSLLRDAVTPGRQRQVVRHYGRQIQAYPRSFALLALGLTTLWLIRRIRR